MYVYTHLPTRVRKASGKNISLVTVIASLVFWGKIAAGFDFAMAFVSLLCLSS